MDQFIVSARKYRPTAFKEVVGQKHIAETLMHEITSSKLAQAFLFTGPRGVGKTTCARILAKVINSQDSSADAGHDFSFNVFELDAASNNSVDDIRNLIDQVRIPPQVGKYKVYIIDEVHMLSTAAFNAFLKTLEEPPNYAIFILATTERHKILPTILSRCQVFNFNRIMASDIVEHLKMIAEKEKLDVAEDALHLIARKADGGLRDALSMFDQLVSFAAGAVTYENAVEMLNLLDLDTFFELSDLFYDEKISEALLLINKVIDQGFDGSLITGGLAQHYRNVMVSKDQITNSLLDVSESFKEKYKEQASKFTLSYILNALSICAESDDKYKMSRNPRLHIELAAIKIAHLKRVISNLGNLSIQKKNDLGLKSNTPVKALSDRALPTIKEDISSKITNTRIGKIDRSAILKKKKAEIENRSSVNNDEPTQSGEVRSNIVSDSVRRISEDLIKARIIDLHGIRIQGALNTSEWKFDGENLILTVSNKASQHSLDEIKTELIQQLNEVSSGSIRKVIIELGEVVQHERRPYTEQEKLEFLKKKHPIMSEVIEKLKLRLP